MNAVAITTTCPSCACAVVAEPDPASGTVECGGCGTRFDPRQSATVAAADAPADAWTPRAGERVGGYQLEREIGRGGMSVVWQARQDSLARPVAIKFLHAHLASDPELRRRFAREAEAMVQLDHPHIVPVIDAGEHGVRPYLVMGLVGLRSLREELGGDAGGVRLPAARVAELSRQCLDALAHAHARGLVHRDIKPDNLLIDEAGALRVTDFGIAQVARGLDGHTLTQLTGTKVVMGTVAYMAPEQGEATRTVDHRCDLYSLGVICYEALRGHRPMGRFEDPADGLGLDAEDAEGWNRFVLALLEREPGRRPADATAARALLDAIGAPAIEPQRMSADEARAAELDGAFAGAAAAAGAAMDQAKAAVDSAAEQVRDAMHRNRERASATTSAMNATPALSDHGRRLLRPQEDRWVSGLCGGLGRWLGVHPDWIRLGAVCSALFLGPGVLVTLAAYIVGVIAVPPCRDVRYRPIPLNHSWTQRPEGWWLGVCAMLGEATAIPAGVWRIGTILTLIFGSWVPYLVLGIILPRRRGVDPMLEVRWTGGAEDPSFRFPREVDAATADGDEAAAAAPAPGQRGRAFRFWSLFALTAAACGFALQGSHGAGASEVLWWLAGATGIAALLAGPRRDGRPRAGSLGGIIAGLAAAELGLLATGLQTNGIAGLAMGFALIGGGAILLAMLSGRHAAVVLGAATVVGVGTAALLANSHFGVIDELRWLPSHQAAVGVVGVIATAIAYGLLRFILPREAGARFALGPLFLGLSALGAIGIVVAVLPPAPNDFGFHVREPLLLGGALLLGGLIMASGRGAWGRLALAGGVLLLLAAPFALFVGVSADSAQHVAAAQNQEELARARAGTQPLVAATPVTGWPRTTGLAPFDDGALRIDFGSTHATVDHHGRRWLPEQVYQRGASWGAVTAQPSHRVKRPESGPAILASDTPLLYTTERYDLDGIVIGVPDGRYELTLHFAETYLGDGRVGERRFDVQIEDSTLVPGFDPLAHAGGADTPTTIEFDDIAVDDGQLDIRFNRTGAGHPPMINGLELIRR